MRSLYSTFLDGPRHAFPRRPKSRGKANQINSIIFRRRPGQHRYPVPDHRRSRVRDRWAQGGVIVVMSDTGNEHPHTYRHIAFIEQLCREHAIEFHFLRSRMGYHPRTWPTLQHQFRRNRVVMSLAYPRTCTDNLKIKPIYNFLDHYVAKQYFGYTDPVHPKGKRYLKRFAREFGPIRILLGIAAGEEHRVAAQGKKALKKMQLNLFK